MRTQSGWFGKLDGLTVGLFTFLVVFGWMNIYATVNPELDGFGWDWNNEAGRQLMFMGLSGLLIFIVLLSDGRLYEVLTVPIYIVTLLLLLAVLAVGKKWEATRVGSPLAVLAFNRPNLPNLALPLMTARVLSQRGVNLKNWSSRWLPAAAVFSLWV